MINVSGHLRNERRVTGFADDSVSLSVNCCGMQVFKTKDYSQNRFAGRVDYQLIYVYKGAGHYWLNNERKVLAPEISFFSVRKSLRSIPIMQMSTLKSIGFISPGITVKI